MVPHTENLKTWSKQSHLLGVFLIHITVLLCLLNWFFRLSGKLSNLSSFFFLFPCYAEIHNSAGEIRWKWQKNKSSFLFCFVLVLCILQANRCLGWRAFSAVASVRWYSFLCWEKSLLPESIVKRFNIIRQLVVPLKEIPHTRNSHSSLFLEEKLSSRETWIHWKPRLNKTDLKKEREGLLSKGPCQWSCPISVSEILKGI